MAQDLKEQAEKLMGDIVRIENERAREWSEFLDEISQISERVRKRMKEYNEVQERSFKQLRNLKQYIGK